MARVPRNIVDSAGHGRSDGCTRRVAGRIVLAIAIISIAGWAMELRDTLESVCASCAMRWDDIAIKIETFNPLDWLGWVQLGTSIIGVLWILYQFNKFRTDNEKRLQEYLERHVEKKKRDHAQERIQTLARFDQAQSTKPKKLRILLAKVAAFLVILWKYVPFAKPVPPAALAVLLVDADNSEEAQKQFSAWGAELLKQAKLFEEQAQAKRLEAGNVYIFAGRLAAASDDGDAARRAIEQVLQDVDGSDMDARELATEIARRSGHLDTARDECDRLYRIAKRHGDRQRMARAFRLKAAIHRTGGSPVLARRALEEGIKIDKADLNHAGVAVCFEQLGDLYAQKQPPAKKAARDNYLPAIERFEIVQDPASIDRIRRKLEQLEPTETQVTISSRIVGSLGRWLTELSMRLRVPVQRKEA